MKIFSSFKADRCLTQLLAHKDPGGPEALALLQSLRSVGPTAISKIIDALATTDRVQTTALVNVLTSYVNDVNLPAFEYGLAHSSKQAAAAVAKALSVSANYDVNRLVPLLFREDVSKGAVIDVLVAARQRLNPRELLRRVYDLDPKDRATAFKIIGEIATPELIPDLIARMEGKESGVRVSIINVLGQFRKPEVARALEKQLKDRNKLVRRAAVEALAGMPTELDIQLIAPLLSDPELEVQSKAVDLVVKLRHPDTIKYLLPALKDESEFARRSAVEVLNEIAEPATIKYLLGVLDDGDWWVRSRASDALAKIGGPKVMDAVLQLVGDKSENIRRSAIEILNQTKDERAVKHLIAATRDTDWWVRERAADALAQVQDPSVAPALVEMLAGDPRSVPAALRALGKLGNSAVLPKLLPLLDSATREIRVEAINTIGQLANSQAPDTVKHKLQTLSTSGEETIARAAALAISRMESVADTAALNSSGNVAADAAHTLLVDNAKVEEMVKGLDKAIVLDINTLRTGDMIEGRYQYIEKIGKGAFGTVVLVEDKVVDERLILKFLNPNVSSDEEMMKRFVHELRYSRKITHQNVIRIYDFVSLGGNYAISMEYFPSHTLGAELSSRQPLPTAKTVRWGCDIATGMAVAHQVGIVHRDLKPANILINKEGLLKIVDFGVAAAASSGDTQLTKTGYVIGSPKYMAPEQILGKKVDHRADVYSLGVILYEMVTGVPPYTKGDHMSVMYQHVQGKARLCQELNPDVSPALAAVVKKSMEIDKVKRYESMDELRLALEGVG
jgi:eukaryotic-like serine/threonine-protein kinase